MHIMIQQLEKWNAKTSKIIQDILSWVGNFINRVTISVYGG